MAITAADVAVWKELRARGHVPESPAVVEIGQANWYGDVDPPRPADLTTVAGRFKAALEFWVETISPSSIRAIDLHGQPGYCVPHDLNEPAPPAWRGQMDVLINTGTAEHVFNQFQFWKTCHDVTRPGGLMVHGAPWVGWCNHGLYSYQPGFFLDLAARNGYEVLLFWATKIAPLEIDPVFKPGDAEHKLVLDPRRDTMLHVAFRKGPDATFKAPMQSCYEDGAGGDSGWRSVPGWLSGNEGRCLQELAAGRRVLELGAWKGRSTCCLAEVAEQVTSVDTFTGDSCTGRADTFEEWRANVEAQGHGGGRVNFVRAPFADAWRYLHNERDLAFVDGEHSAGGTEEACRLALRCVRPGGVVAVHDWHLESVREGARRCGLLRPDGAAGSVVWFNVEGGGQ